MYLHPAVHPAREGARCFYKINYLSVVFVKELEGKAISDRVRIDFLGISHWQFKKLIDYNYHNFILGKTYEWERELITALRRLDEE